MLHDWGVIAAAFGYIGLLFLVASHGDRLSPLKRGWASPLIYPLSLAIYCTSWTFFGSVGFATRTSFDFLAIYVGPILMIGLCTPLLRRVIYRAGRGDSVAALARRYRVAPAELAQWNKVGADSQFASGQQVVIYVPSATTRVARAGSRGKRGGPQGCHRGRGPGEGQPPVAGPDRSPPCAGRPPAQLPLRQVQDQGQVRAEAFARTAHRGGRRSGRGAQGLRQD